MYNIEYVCGLGYGDEGKGRIAAYVATKYDTDDTISVLCSGSSQRGHTMVDENGVRHVFHHLAVLLCMAILIILMIDSMLTL